MYDGYRAIATAYDRLNADVDYIAWSEFLEACFDKFLPARPRIVLDLACGTGRMTFPLADRGYDMIGIDGSADMLAEAFDIIFFVSWLFEYFNYFVWVVNRST